jgi:hypothetical protein
MGYYFHFLIKQKIHNAGKAEITATAPYEGTVNFIINLPLYGVVNKAYETSKGNFEYENKIYSILGRKIENNQLIVTCVADPKLKKFQEELLGFIDTYILEKNSQKKDSKGSSFKFFSPEYAGFFKTTHFYLYYFFEPSTTTPYLKTFSHRAPQVPKRPPISIS